MGPVFWLIAHNYPVLRCPSHSVLPPTGTVYCHHSRPLSAIVLITSLLLPETSQQIFHQCSQFWGFVCPDTNNLSCVSSLDQVAGSALWRQVGQWPWPYFYIHLSESGAFRHPPKLEFVVVGCWDSRTSCSYTNCTWGKSADIRDHSDWPLKWECNTYELCVKYSFLVWRSKAPSMKHPLQRTPTHTPHSSGAPLLSLSDEHRHPSFSCSSSKGANTLYF